MIDRLKEAFSRLEQLSAEKQKIAATSIQAFIQALEREAEAHRQVFPEESRKDTSSDTE